MFLHDHLRNSLSTQCLATLELLPFESSQSIEQRCNEQYDGGGDQTGCSGDDAEPLDDGHDGVDAGAHIVGRESADEFIEFRRGRADSEEERDFDEEYYEGADSVHASVGGGRAGAGGLMYRQITLKTITQWKLKMLAMPSAKHKIMAIMPVLVGVSRAHLEYVVVLCYYHWPYIPGWVAWSVCIVVCRCNCEWTH